jgi:hypothetical protein
MKARMHRLLHKLKLCSCFNDGNKYRKRPMPKKTQNPTIRERHRNINLSTELSDSIMPLWVNTQGELLASIDNRFYKLDSLNHNLSSSFTKDITKP